MAAQSALLLFSCSPCFDYVAVSTRLPLHPSQSRQQRWNSVQNDAPDNIVVYSHVAMRKTIAHGYDRGPRDFRVGLTDRIGNMGSRFANEFQIPQRGIVDKCVPDEGILIQSRR